MAVSEKLCFCTLNVALQKIDRFALCVSFEQVYQWNDLDRRGAIAIAVLHVVGPFFSPCELHLPAVRTHAGWHKCNLMLELRCFRIPEAQAAVPGVWLDREDVGPGEEFVPVTKREPGIRSKVHYACHIAQALPNKSVFPGLKNLLQNQPVRCPKPKVKEILMALQHYSGNRMAAGQRQLMQFA
jgi:hypothetical protein